MRTGPLMLAVILILIGGVWFLQGIHVLPGSFMTGSRFWAVAGAVVGVAGIALFLRVARRGGP